MGRHDWYRNEDWNAEIESAFMEKLKRSREKSQYLRVQAVYLGRSYPDIALKLLELYFAEGDDLDHCTARWQQARIYEAQGNIDKATEAYLAALAAEDAFPNSKSGASVDFLFFVARHKLSAFYTRVEELFERSNLDFPDELFKTSAAMAFIERDLGNMKLAREFADQALVAAQAEHSGFQYHPDVGLVGEEYQSELRELKSILEISSR